MKIKKRIEEGRIKDFHLKEDVFWYKGISCVPNVVELKREVMKESHNSNFTTHPRSTKMYHDLKTHFFHGLESKETCQIFA